MKHAYLIVLLALAGCDAAHYSTTPDTKGGIWIVDSKTGNAIRYCKFATFGSNYERPSCLKAE